MTIRTVLVALGASLAACDARAQSPVDRPATADASAAVGARSLEETWNRAAEEAVERGLVWLAGQQNARGFWGGVVGDKTRARYVPIRAIEEQERDGTGHLGVTALCGMAFLAGGHLPGRGRFGPNVDRALDAVLSCVRENGIATVAGSRMYSHAFALLFLAEVYGMARNERIRGAIENATNIVVDSQNHEGGWRYNAFSQDADLSITVCALQALRAVRNIGIRVPRSTIDRAIEYVASCRVQSGRRAGLYAYKATGRVRKTTQYSIQAAAVTSLVSAGVHRKDLIEPVMEFLADEYGHVAERYPHHFYFWYGNYYASQAFFHAEVLFGDGSFLRYYEFLRDHLLADQEPDGRWRNPRIEGPGDSFGTAVACILLQIPKQYLPIFQR